jgi:hypothetical protein
MGEVWFKRVGHFFFKAAVRLLVIVVFVSVDDDEYLRFAPNSVVMPMFAANPSNTTDLTD